MDGDCIDLEQHYEQALWLTVSGQGDNGLGYGKEEIVGTLACANQEVTILPHWGVGVSDLLYAGYPCGKNQLPFVMPLPELPDTHQFSSLFVSGPRWYRQPGQPEEAWHSLYLLWPHCEEQADRTVNIELSHPWGAQIRRVGKGILIGQAVVSGKLVTHALVIYSRIRNKDLGDSVGLKAIQWTFEGSNAPPEVLRKHPQAQQAIDLYQEHCEPTHTGNTPPYWDTLLDDLAAECKAATKGATPVEASNWISTPWDILAFAIAYERGANAKSPFFRNKVEQALARIWEYLPEERQQFLSTLWPLTYRFLYRRQKIG